MCHTIQASDEQIERLPGVVIVSAPFQRHLAGRMLALAKARTLPRAMTAHEQRDENVVDLEMESSLVKQ
jgi:hypothetical protein